MHQKKETRLARKMTKKWKHFKRISDQKTGGSTLDQDVFFL